jgi:wyosine [tRNA(Phe)-imidazoG37] synthetase (radical SAM superfamily)
MPTSSFDKTFIVTNASAIAQIRKDMEQPRLVKVNRRDFEAENQKGIQLLKAKLNIKP